VYLRLLPALVVVALACLHGAAAPARVVPAGASLQAAIDAAAPGDRLIVEGVHAEALAINKAIDLVGRPGAVITGSQAPLVRVHDARGVALSALTIRQTGLKPGAPGHAAIHVARAELRLRDVRVEAATAGVAVVAGGRLDAEGLAVEGARGAGLLFAADAGGTVVGSSFKRNGVGVWADDDARPDVRRCAFAGNHHGILVSGRAAPAIEACTFARSGGEDVHVTDQGAPRLVGAGARPAAAPIRAGLVAAADAKAIRRVAEDFEADFMGAIEDQGSADIPGKQLSRAFAELQATPLSRKRLDEARRYLKLAQQAGEAEAFGPAYHELDRFLRKYEP